jgi:hypothetical protein
MFYAILPKISAAMVSQVVAKPASLRRSVDVSTFCNLGFAGRLEETDGGNLLHLPVGEIAL